MLMKSTPVKTFTLGAVSSGSYKVYKTFQVAMQNAAEPANIKNHCGTLFSYLLCSWILMSRSIVHGRYVIRVAPFSLFLLWDTRTRLKKCCMMFCPPNENVYLILYFILCLLFYLLFCTNQHKIVWLEQEKSIFYPRLAHVGHVDSYSFTTISALVWN